MLRPLLITGVLLAGLAPSPAPAAGPVTGQVGPDTSGRAVAVPQSGGNIDRHILGKARVDPRPPRQREKVIVLPIGARRPDQWEISHRELKGSFIGGPDNYLKIVAPGQYRLHGTVAPWYRVTGDPCALRPADALRRASAAARRRGIGLNGADRVMVYLHCPHGNDSYTTQPGRVTWYYGFYNTLNPELVVHDLGHNFGLGHADGLACELDGVVTLLRGKCRSVPSGDSLDLMGSARVAFSIFNAASRHSIGWLSDFATLRTSGTRSITRSERRRGNEAVRILAPGRVSYWVEAGPADGFGPGVVIRRQRGPRTELLRPFAGYRGSPFAHVSVPVGGSVTLTHGIRVSVLSAEGREMRVHADFDAPAPGRPSAPRDVAVRHGSRQILVSWNHPESDNGAVVQRYRVRVPEVGYDKVLARNVFQTWVRVPRDVTGSVEVRALNEYGASEAGTQSFRTYDWTPEVAITSPASGTTLNGEVRVTADITYPPGSPEQTTEFYLHIDSGGFPVVRDAPDGDGLIWDTRGTRNGVHRLQITSAGTEHSASSERIEVVVDNP